MQKWMKIEDRYYQQQKDSPESVDFSYVGLQIMHKYAGRVS